MPIALSAAQVPLVDGTVDTAKIAQVAVFGDAWSLWQAAARPLAEMRAEYRVPPLDPAFAAGGAVPAWYRPSA